MSIINYSNYTHLNLIVIVSLKRGRLLDLRETDEMLELSLIKTDFKT